MLKRDPQNILYKEECLDIVKKKINEEFHLINYVTVPVDNTLGYMGQYFKLKVTISSKKFSNSIMVNDNNINTLNYFIKIPPQLNTIQYDFNKEQGSFTKEVNLYNNLFPKMFDGLINNSIPSCFLALDNDVIVLDDMHSEGYRMTNKMMPFDLDHCKIVMESLAKFHARSIIFEENHKINVYNEYSYCLHETLWPDKDGLSTKMYKAAVKGLISLIDMVDEIKKNVKLQLKKKLLLLCRNHSEKLLPSNQYKNVLCHGDLWANNILYKYNSVGKPILCCFVDFQLARYNTPAHDIITFLQFTTTKTFREKHFQTLIKIYHDTFVHLIAEKNLDYKNIMPWDVFLQSIATNRISFMIHGILNTPIMLLQSEAIQKYLSNESAVKSFLYDDRTPLIHHEFNTNSHYRMRLSDAVIELQEWLIK